MSVSFISTFPTFPADGPENHPHIIDIATYQEASDSGTLTDLDFGLWDTIATLLYTISPDTLLDFFDPSKNEFKLVLNRKGNDTSVVVWKQDSEVFVGDYIDLHKYNTYEWDHAIRCKIDSTGAWSITYASYGLYSKPDWSAVWRGEFTKEMPGRGDVSADDQSRFDRAFLLARDIMDGQPWDSQDYNRVVQTD